MRPEEEHLLWLQQNREQIDASLRDHQTSRNLDVIKAAVQRAVRSTLNDCEIDLVQRFPDLAKLAKARKRKGGT